MNAIISVKYEGHLFDNHTIRVGDLATATLAFELLSNTIAKEFCGKDAKIILYAQTPKDGCWWQDLLVHLAEGTAIKQTDLFVTHHPTITLAILVSIFTVAMTHIILTAAWTPKHIKQYRLFFQENKVPVSEKDIQKLQELAQKPEIRRMVYEQISPYKNTNDDKNKLTLGVSCFEFPSINNEQIQKGLVDLNYLEETIEKRTYDNMEIIPEDVSLVGNDSWKVKFENEFGEELSVKIKIKDTKFLSSIREENTDFNAKMKLRAELESEHIKRLRTRDTKNWYITQVFSLTKDGKEVYRSKD
jgi:hypothetical protein